VAVAAAGGVVGGGTVESMTAGDWALNLVGSALETLLFARLFLNELLAERNEVLARNILEQCRLYQKKEDRRPWWSRLPLPPGRSSGDRVSVPAGARAAEQQEEEEEEEAVAVVAVLGMAHCNGIMRLLKEQRVR
jgi:hypothetical protein